MQETFSMKGMISPRGAVAVAAGSVLNPGPATQPSRSAEACRPGARSPPPLRAPNPPGLEPENGAKSKHYTEKRFEPCSCIHSLAKSETGWDVGPLCLLPRSRRHRG